jgi:hypothetical protein
MDYSENDDKCLIDLLEATNLYSIAVLSVAGLTVAFVLTCILCLHKCMQDSPALESKIWFSIGAVKIFAGVVLFAVFQPRCPDGCVCGDLPLPIYPVFCLLIGLRWLLRGWALQNQNNARGSADEPTFQFVKMSEMTQVV